MYLSKYNRRSIRFLGYDYSQEGCYFVTICCQDRIHIMEHKMKLNKYGFVVKNVWNNLSNHYPHIQLGEFVIMPNHIDVIIISNHSVGTGLKPASTKNHGLREIIRALKTFSSRTINEMRNTIGKKLWQLNYYEHIIRDEQCYDAIAEYIENNPSNWDTDECRSCRGKGCPCPNRIHDLYINI